MYKISEENVFYCIKEVSNLLTKDLVLNKKLNVLLTIDFISLTYRKIISVTIVEVNYKVLIEITVTIMVLEVIKIAYQIFYYQKEVLISDILVFKIVLVIIIRFYNFVILKEEDI